MRDDVECPYCGEDQEINHDDGMGYDENETHQQECSDCGKTFVFTTSISYYYEAEKADCLNDEKHTFEKVSRYPCVLFGKVLIRCSQCDEEEQIDYKDAHKYGYNQKEVNESAEKDKKLRGEKK